MESTKDVRKNVEVNEYQEALDRLKTHCLSSPSLQNGEENGFGPDYDMHHDCYEDETQLLQELVDKEIPMKVKNIKPAGHSLYLGECPRCNTTIDYLDYPYTCCAKGCRQALDWGKDE